MVASFVSQFNIAKRCRAYGLPIWQCPNFLFLVMGALIIVSILFSYAVGTKFIGDPLLVAFLTIVLTGILLIIAFIITSSVERLAEASRLKAEFVSIVSHQLRSPLSNLQWNIEVLMSDKMKLGEEEKMGYLHILKENSDRMQDLVSDLLVVSRIQEGTLQLNKTNFSFKELLKTLIAEFELLVQASNITIHIEGDEHLPQIFSDSKVVMQITQNLFENAIHYGKGTIRIQYAIKKNNFYFEIEDNGVGIPEKDHQHIFQKFFRSNNVLRYQTQGTGLGLYIAKSMVERLGGTIGFRSKEYKGSTFWFTIPLAFSK